jgi:hypothetical protein
MACELMNDGFGKDVEEGPVAVPARGNTDRF